MYNYTQMPVLHSTQYTVHSMYAKSFFHRCQKTFQLSLVWRGVGAGPGGQVEGVGQAQKKSFCPQCLHYHPPRDYRPAMTLRIIRDIQSLQLRITEKHREEDRAALEL